MSKLSSSRTQSPKQSTGLFLFFELPCSILCSLHQKRKYRKTILPFLAQKERLAHRKLKLSSARTQAPKQSTGLFLFFELPCSILCSLHQKRKYRKTILPFLAQKERLELSRRLPDLRP